MTYEINTVTISVKSRTATSSMASACLQYVMSLTTDNGSVVTISE